MILCLARMAQGMTIIFKGREEGHQEEVLQDQGRRDQGHPEEDHRDHHARQGHRVRRAVAETSSRR